MMQIFACRNLHCDEMRISSRPACRLLHASTSYLKVWFGKLKPVIWFEGDMARLTGARMATKCIRALASLIRSTK
jgi:hypothetical protein